jgi:hypothetical protein
MSRLWMEESDGERWLINPSLIIANPRARKARKNRRGKKMALRRRRRSRRNRMPAGLRRFWAKHRRHRTNRVHRRRTRRARLNPPRRRRRARRNYAASGMLAMNRRRRRSYRRNRVMRHRRRARRNPSLLGFTLPPVMDIAAVGAGYVVSPLLANYVWNNWVAGTSLGTSKWAYLGVEAISVAVPAMVVRRFVNVRAGNLMLLGGAAKVALDLINTLAPTLLPAVATPTGLGFYETMGPRRALSGVGEQPFLGRYLTRGRPIPQSGRMISSVPDRLDPGARF